MSLYSERLLVPDWELEGILSLLLPILHTGNVTENIDGRMSLLIAAIWMASAQQYRPGRSAEPSIETFKQFIVNVLWMYLNVEFLHKHQQFSPEHTKFIFLLVRQFMVTSGFQSNLVEIDLRNMVGMSSSQVATEIQHIVSPMDTQHYLLPHDTVNPETVISGYFENEIALFTLVQSEEGEGSANRLEAIQIVRTGSPGHYRYIIFLLFAGLVFETTESQLANTLQLLFQNIHSHGQVDGTEPPATVAEFEGFDLLSVDFWQSLHTSTQHNTQQMGLWDHIEVALGVSTGVMGFYLIGRRLIQGEVSSEECAFGVTVLSLFIASVLHNRNRKGHF